MATRACTQLLGATHIEKLLIVCETLCLRLRLRLVEVNAVVEWKALDSQDAGVNDGINKVANLKMLR